MKIKGKLITSGRFSLSHLGVDFDFGNSQQYVLSIIEDGTPTNSVVVSGQWEMESIIELAQKLHDKLELNLENGYKSLSVTDMNIKLEACLKEGDEYSLKIYFHEQKPSYTKSGIITSWKHRVKSASEIKHLLACLILIPTRPWRELCELPITRDAKGLPLAFRGQFVPDAVGYSSWERVSDDLGFLTGAIESLSQFDDMGLCSLVEIQKHCVSRLKSSYSKKCCTDCSTTILITSSDRYKTRCDRCAFLHKEALLADQTSAQCLDCGGSFQRHPSEYWKIRCVPCWAKDKAAKHVDEMRKMQEYYKNLLHRRPTC